MKYSITEKKLFNVIDIIMRGQFGDLNAIGGANTPTRHSLATLARPARCIHARRQLHPYKAALRLA